MVSVSGKHDNYKLSSFTTEVGRSVAQDEEDDDGADDDDDDDDEEEEKEEEEEEKEEDEEEKEEEDDEGGKVEGEHSSGRAIRFLFAAPGMPELS